MGLTCPAESRGIRLPGRETGARRLLFEAAFLSRVGGLTGIDAVAERPDDDL